MQYLYNSQDVIETVISVLEHAMASSTAYQSLGYLCASQWDCKSSRTVVSWILTTVAAPWALAVTEGENIRHITCLCHRARVILTSVFGYQTLHFSGGCMAVPFLQWNTSENASKFCKDPITLHKEKELIYMDTGHGDCCFENRKPCWNSSLKRQDNLCNKNTADRNNEMLEQSILVHSLQTGKFTRPSKGMCSPALSYKLWKKLLKLVQIDLVC